MKELGGLAYSDAGGAMGALVEERSLCISQPESDQDLDHVRELFVEYQRYIDVDLCFQSFDEELRSLPGRYAPPAGSLLLARVGDAIIGGVAMAPLKRDFCEMKRLYVRPEWRGRGYGRRLADAIIERGRRAGYTTMRLDTLRRLHEALVLYESMGFRRIGSYRYNPLEDVVYMEIDLRT